MACQQVRFGCKKAFHVGHYDNIRRKDIPPGALVISPGTLPVRLIPIFHGGRVSSSVHGGIGWCCLCPTLQRHLNLSHPARIVSQWSEVWRSTEVYVSAKPAIRSSTI